LHSQRSRTWSKSCPFYCQISSCVCSRAILHTYKVMGQSLKLLMVFLQIRFSLNMKEQSMTRKYIWKCFLSNGGLGSFWFLI
jgi:hypothetical protein